MLENKLRISLRATIVTGMIRTEHGIQQDEAFDKAFDMASAERGLKLSTATHQEISAAIRDAHTVDIEEAVARADDLLSFFADRLKVHLRERGARHDLIDAVFSLAGQDDLLDDRAPRRGAGAVPRQR